MSRRTLSLCTLVLLMPAALFAQALTVNRASAMAPSASTRMATRTRSPHNGFTPSAFAVAFGSGP